MDTRAASTHIGAWAEEHVDEPDHRERFREVVERELLSLHDGNFARYGVRPSEFASWQAAWRGQAPSGSGRGDAVNADPPARLLEVALLHPPHPAGSATPATSTVKAETERRKWQATETRD